jgi:hypothetical protein
VIVSVVAIVIDACLLFVPVADAGDIFNDVRRQNGLPSARDAMEPDGTLSEVNPVVPFGGFEDPVPSPFLVQSLGSAMKSPWACSPWYRSL